MFRPVSSLRSGDRPSTATPASLRLCGRTIPVVLPSRRDVRLRLAAVITSLQVLGQTALGFRVSLAQILVCVGCCALIEVAVSARSRRALVWPASALLTGNSIAFILRTTGTRHGDWWSLDGIQYFLFACAVAMASKHLMRPDGRHIYNPSNAGLVACLLIAGAGRVYPQYLWWGSMGLPLVLALAVILAGTVAVVRPVGMLPMAVSFLVPFGAAVAVLAATGHCFAATWSVAPVCGGSFVSDTLLSPEVLVFVLFMMSDPRTAPEPGRGRCAYGVLTALVAALLIHAQSTEYGVKAAILASLTLVCTAVSLARLRSTRPRPRRRVAARAPVAAAAIIAVAVTLSVGGLAGDPHLLNMEETPSLPGTAGGQ